VTALWLLAIIALSATASLRPALLLQWTPYLPGRDKTGHFLLMGGFAAVAVLAFAGRRVGSRTISVAAVSLAVTLIVVSEEGLQRWLPSRTLSLEDLAYSLAGVFICGGLACAWRAFRGGRGQDP
jgi:VanZ family protein